MLMAAALLALAAPLSAAPVPFEIDLAHSEVGFSIRHFFSRVPGRFNDFAGTVQLDEQNMANSSVDVTIQATSIFTNNERRDKHLRSGDFFAADSFTTITFKSTKVTPGENGKLAIAGNLTIRGITKPVVLDAHFLGAGKVDVGGRPAGYRAGFEATTTINRQDYNVTWNKVLDQGGTMLGDDVQINLGVEAVKVEAEKANVVPPAGKKP
jgi:polyisoprenoid-binding protein YceI